MSGVLDDLALRLPCPACGAEPGYWCVTYRPTVREPGLITMWLHQPRLQIVDDAYRAGQRDGGHRALDVAAHRLQSRREGVWWATRPEEGIPAITGGETVEAWLRGLSAQWARRGY